MKNTMLSIVLGLAIALASVAPASVSAGDKVHKVAIQVNDKDWARINLALNNATNLVKYYGVANVEIEIVAYGGGLDMYGKDSKVQTRLLSLHKFGNVKFGVCANTMAKRKWTKKDLLQDVFIQESIVPSGVVRLIELQEAGFSYIKP